MANDKDSRLARHAPQRPIDETDRHTEDTTPHDPAQHRRQTRGREPQQGYAKRQNSQYIQDRACAALQLYHHILFNRYVWYAGSNFYKSPFAAHHFG